MLLAPAITHAQDLGLREAPTGARIVRNVFVRFKGAATLDEARVRSQMATRPGSPYLDETVERDIRSLYATGAVENLDIQAQNIGGNGVNVIVTISGRGAIGEIYFAGNTVFNAEKLRMEIKTRVGDAVDEIKLAAAQSDIREMYEKKGYPDVGVSYETTPSSREGFTAVTFKIDEGARGLIKDIIFEGLTCTKHFKLREKLKSKEKTFWRIWGKAGKLNNEDVQSDIKTVEHAMQDRGYAYAKVVEVRRDPVNRNSVNLVFVCVEGQKYDVAGVSVTGNTVFSQDELMPGISTEAGFPYSGADVRADEKMIQEYYGSRGYSDARVDTSILNAGPGQVKVNYAITEGSKFYINRINITGNSVTKDEVIRRELPIAPGEELNTVKMNTGKTRLEQLNYFSQVDVRTNPTSAPDRKDIDVNVQETTTGTVNFGAGFSSIDSISAFVGVTQTNFDIRDWSDFRGGGQRFNANARVGLLRRDFNVTWTEPWFRGEKLALTVDLFYRNLFYLSDVYDQSNGGFSVGLRKSMGEHAYWETTYTLQMVSIDNIDAAASPQIRQEQGDYIQSKIDGRWVHDTRDSIFITRSGHKFEAGGLVSGLGGDAQVWGINFAGQQFFTFPGDVILSFEGAFSSVDTWGSGTVPIFERQFLGGANNLRGFNFRHVGPKDATGEPLGGLSSLYGTAEVSVPIIEKFRIAAFYDVGSVGTSSFDVGGKVYSDYGLGVRLFMSSLGPIRIDYALPHQGDNFTGDSGRFQFNMGYKF
ncbi:MAG: outer membrane protein assembly factor BamA [Verrucomicrobiaceae bacterium]|nr:outer membrane protein assembly factor BamA [Verrucomicrobiaceae bacterium]